MLDLKAGDKAIYHVKDVEALSAPVQIDEVLDDDTYAVRFLGDDEVFTTPGDQLTEMRDRMP
jgi:hypothetical protein